MKPHLPLLLLGAALWGCSTTSQEASAPLEDVTEEVSVSLLTRLVPIPAGTYRPLYSAPGQPTEISRPSFLLEEHPVTNAQYLAFVEANPRWRKSQVASLMAEANYLSHWSDDLVFPLEAADSPVTNVSWFAARAYAHWAGRRLPTLAEWESVGMSSKTAAFGRDEEGYNQRILNWYSRPTPAFPESVLSHEPNYFGVSDMHGLIWEWVGDFNSSLVTGESRGDSGLDRNLFCGSESIGAADPSDYAAFMRFAFRGSLDGHFTVNNLGFRCAADLVSTETATPSKR